MLHIENTIGQLLEKERRLPVPISMQSHLYKDLAIDSLSFVSFLLTLEKTFAITIDITEMESCLIVGELIALINRKVKEL